MFKQIFNRPNQNILSILSSNFKFKKRVSKNYLLKNSSIRSNLYVTNNVIDNNQNLFLFSKLQLGSNVLLRNKKYMIEGFRFQSTIVNQQSQPLETNSLEMMIDQTLLLKGQKSKMNNDGKRPNFIANESSNLFLLKKKLRM